MKPSSEPLSWEAELPLLTRAMFRQWSGAMLATVLLMALILVPIFAVQGEWKALPMLLSVLMAVSLGLWLLGFLVVGLVFRGRMRVRYTLTDRGVLQETLDRTIRGASRLAIVAGVLARSPQLVGSGLIAKSREAEAIEWPRVARADDDPEHHVITLRNSWRTLLWIQCLPENHGRVREYIHQALAGNPAGSESAQRSPLPRHLLHSALIMLACAPLFMLVEEFGLDLLVALLVLCFALATLWLIPLFGWVVLAGLGWLGVELLLQLTLERSSYIFPGRTYRSYEVLDANDAILLGIAAAGAAYLGWLAVSALRGRLVSMLLRDLG